MKGVTVFAINTALFAGFILLALAGCAPEPPARPNLIVVVVDDARADGVDRMPVVQKRLAPEGVWFENSFTPAALCCPSRASFLTGLYSLHHGTRQVIGHGAHSDIIVASAKAYLHALNKLSWHKRQHGVSEPKGI